MSQRGIPQEGQLPGVRNKAALWDPVLGGQMPGLCVTIPFQGSLARTPPWEWDDTRVQDGDLQGMVQGWGLLTPSAAPHHLANEDVCLGRDSGRATKPSPLET